MREGYKNTVLGEIPEDWEVVKLGEVLAEIKSGLSRKLSLEDIGIPVLRSNNLLNNKVSAKELKYWYVDDPQGAKVSDYYVQDGDILINFINSTSQIGKSAIFKKLLDRDVIYTTNILKLTVDNSNSNHFISYFTQSDMYWPQIKLITKPAVNQASFTTSDFKKILLPLPQLPEQKKIAEILSTVDEKIDAIEQQIVETSELKKGLMQKLLTKGIGHTKFKDSPLGEIPESWEVVKQVEVATFLNGRAYKQSEWETVGIPVIRLQNLTGRGTEYYYSTIKLPDFQYCNKGDLLYMWSATFGPVIWKGDKAIYHYHIWKIENDVNKLDKSFHYYLLSEVTNRMKNQSHGSTMLHVTKVGMEKLLIQLPPLPEQKQIAKILSTVDEKLEVLREKKAEYQEMKKGLMQQLLTGKVRVKVLQ